MRLSSDLEVVGRPVVVCGGAPTALGVVTDLLGEGAVITVCAPIVPTTVRDLADRSLIIWQQRSWSVDDVAEAALVVSAAESTEENQRIARAARAAGRLCLASSSEDTETETATSPVGHVTLVGGGPGDPGLLTLAGLAAIKAADVIICDRLAPLAALSEARAGVEIIDVAKIPRGEYTSQEKINELLVQHARAGKQVVRLKGGDSFVFGRGGEELLACAAAGVPVTVVPGVTSSIAAPAAAGVPVTHRGVAHEFTVVSGHVAPDSPASLVRWEALAGLRGTLVVLMGLKNLAAITATLIAHGKPAETPAAVVQEATTGAQRVLRSTLGAVAADVAAAGLRPPAVVVLGDVVDALAGAGPEEFPGSPLAPGGQA